ncbi:MAG: Vgb family protein, partial [Planctomycetota bacterium]
VSSSSDVAREVYANTGVMVRDSATLASQPADLRVGPDGLVYVSSTLQSKVVRFDPATGASLGDFVPSGFAGLSQAMGLAFTPEGHLLVASAGTNSVLQFDGQTGAFLGVFIDDSSGLTLPYGLIFGPNGNLFVSTNDRVLEFDGVSGDFVGEFVGPGSGGLAEPRGLLFKPDGNLLVASFGSNAVLEYDGQSGEFIEQFDRGGNDDGFWALQMPVALRLTAVQDAVLVSSNAGNAAIHSYDLATGLFRRSFYVLSAEVPAPTGFDVMPASPLDCNANLIPDVCEINDGTAADANGNGVIDGCESGCPADSNGDGSVDADDLVDAILAWGPCADCASDVTLDGVVNTEDLLAIILAWGPCP